LTTSGTVSTFVYDNQKILDHSFRRAGYKTEEITAEYIQIALEIIYTLTAEWINSGFPLWTQQFILLAATIGSPSVPTPNGTVDILTPFWRILNPWRGAATTTAGADASPLCAGQPNSDIVIAGPNAGVTVAFGGSMEVDCIGVLLGGAVPLTAALDLLVSTDGATFTVAQSLPSTIFTPGTWAYFDLDPSISASYLQIRRPGAGNLTLNQLNFGLAQSQDIPLGNHGPSLNIDDYFNLPDKHYQSGQPNSAYVVRQAATPLLKLWPVPNTAAFYNGTPAALVRRYIQDPGSMSNTMEVPQRWLEALQWQLAKGLMDELPQPKIDPSAGYSAIAISQEMQQRYQRVQANMQRSTMLAWAEERTKGPLNLAPDISGYTA
jgi:hypothetical protein